MMHSFGLNDYSRLFFESRSTMRNLSHSRLILPLLSVSLLVVANGAAQSTGVDSTRGPTEVAAAPARVMLAQSGSMGGTIGNQEKSLSGSRDAQPEPPAQRSTPKESRKPSASGGGSAATFDGSWSISSAGITCSDTFRETVVVKGTRLTGNYGTGSVSATGSVRGSGNYSGVGVTSQGRFSGRSGSGTFQRSDGCRGRWTASKL
jgi:hypothetical protein